MERTKVQAQATLARRLRRQAGWCRELGSPLYGHLLEHAATDVEACGPCWRVLEGREADPSESAVALRLLGAVHRLVLEGRAPDLARHYPSVGGGPGTPDAWHDFRAAVEENAAELRGLVRRPMQTNEVGRCAALLGGFLLVVKESGLPLRLLEVGASAGLNLRWDHYRYEGAGAAWGDPGSPVRLTGVFVDDPPPLGVGAQVVERSGCDRRPLDPATREGRLTLTSYVWPDQAERLERLRGALEVARRVPAQVEGADAPAWLEARLARAVGGAATVVFHSVFVQYLDEPGRGRLRAVIEKAGRRATAEAPLAWLRMEPGETGMDVRLTSWPRGIERLVARARAHGQTVRWLAG